MVTIPPIRMVIWGMVYYCFNQITGIILITITITIIIITMNMIATIITTIITMFSAITTIITTMIIIGDFYSPWKVTIVSWKVTIVSLGLLEDTTGIICLGDCYCW